MGRHLKPRTANPTRRGRSIFLCGGERLSTTISPTPTPSARHSGLYQVCPLIAIGLGTYIHHAPRASSNRPKLQGSGLDHPTADVASPRRTRTLDRSRRFGSAPRPLGLGRYQRGYRSRTLASVGGDRCQCHSSRKQQPQQEGAGGPRRWRRRRTGPHGDEQRRCRGQCL